MTLRQRYLATAVLAAAGPLLYIFAVPFWKGLTESEEHAFDISLNPYVPWLNGKDAEGDAVVLVAMYEWLNNNTAGIGHG